MPEYFSKSLELVSFSLGSKEKIRLNFLPLINSIRRSFLSGYFIFIKQKLVEYCSEWTTVLSLISPFDISGLFDLERIADSEDTHKMTFDDCIFTINVASTFPDGPILTFLCYMSMILQGSHRWISFSQWIFPSIRVPFTILLSAEELPDGNVVGHWRWSCVVSHWFFVSEHTVLSFMVNRKILDKKIKVTE